MERDRSRMEEPELAEEEKEEEGERIREGVKGGEPTGPGGEPTGPGGGRPGGGKNEKGREEDS